MARPALEELPVGGGGRTGTHIRLEQAGTGQGAIRGLLRPLGSEKDKTMWVGEIQILTGGC